MSLNKMSEQFSNEASISSASAAVERLSQWIEKNGWAGYDPYDIQGTPLYMWALGLSRSSFVKRLFRKLVLGPLLLGEVRFPLLFRKLFRVKPSINAKGMSLYVIALFNLYQVTGNLKYQSQAIDCLNWLLENQAPGYEHPCWGYPFDWDSGVIVPALSPSSVVSAAAFDAFWKAFEVTGEDKYLQTCVGICKFFVDDLNIDNIDEETICFSYTPLDDFHVHNTNLLVAHCLLKVGVEIKHGDWISLGEKAANYALKEQNENGSLFYWGKVQNYMCPDRVDQYHSGFEMRCLFSIWQSTGKSKYKEALDRYYAFYSKNLLKKEGDLIFPKMYPSAVYPINVHSCAEGLLLNSVLSSQYDASSQVVTKMLPWVIDKMQLKDGRFMYTRRKLWGFEWCSKIGYWRWGQAWMVLALSEVLVMLTGVKQDSTSELPNEQ